MTFEIIIAYRQDCGTDILDVLCEVLKDALVNNNNEFEDDDVKAMIVPCYKRDDKISYDENGNASNHVLLGFRLVLIDEITQAQLVVDEFASAVQDTPPVFHVLKFEDPLLQQELAHRAEEIFALEMKLRRVLSLIYLHAQQDGEPYNLLREEKVKLMEKPKEKDMKTMAENQFFHLTFSKYNELNQRAEIKLQMLIDIIRNAEKYEEFHNEIIRRPIGNEDDSATLAKLQDKMEAIEEMRNCVAHNRRPLEDIIRNYEYSLPLVDGMLDDYLARWAWNTVAIEEV